MSIKRKIQLKRILPKDCGELTDRTVSISRVAKVVKGGRRFSFNALVVTGDGMGNVGYGTGKAGEVPDAIRKASEAARKSLVKVAIRGTTIPHDIVATFGPAEVILKPAAPGTGVIAGSVVRSVLESAGIKDVRTKCIGSTSPNHTILAVLDGLLSIKDPKEVAEIRGISEEDMEYSAY